jgi:hypothetical protein
MLTSPGWYVAICCVPTLFFDLCAAIVVFLPLRGAVVVASAIGPITKISTVALFAYAIWHFGIFTGVGVVVISFACSRITDRCIGKLLGGFVERRIARDRQALIHTILDKAGVVETGAMAAAVEDLESYDGPTLRDLAIEVFDSARPGHTLLMGRIKRRLDEMGHDSDDYSAALVTSDRQELSDIRNWLLTEVGILDEDARHISTRLQAPKKTRRRRKAKTAIAEEPAKLRSEQPGDRR